MSVHSTKTCGYQHTCAHSAAAPHTDRTQPLLALHRTVTLRPACFIMQQRASQHAIVVIYIWSGFIGAWRPSLDRPALLPAMANAHAAMHRITMALHDAAAGLP